MIASDFSANTQYHKLQCTLQLYIFQHVTLHFSIKKVQPMIKKIYTIIPLNSKNSLISLAIGPSD